MDVYKSELDRERRARLAATQLFEQKHSSLKQAHSELSQHSLRLAEQVVAQRNAIERLEREKEQALTQVAELMALRLAGSPAADNAKTMFLTKMSHEFRTPLNGVINMAEILFERITDDELKICAETVKSSGEQLLNFTEKLLIYAGLCENDLVLDANPFDLREELAKSVAYANTLKADKEIEVSLDLFPNFPAQLIGDKTRFTQIIENLVSNAVAFTQSGFVQIGAGWKQGEDAQSADVVIWVQDSGVGIDDDQHDHILGDFNQAQDGANREHDGAGIGLSIVSKLVDAMDGVLEITSVKGLGSRFEVSLALAVPEDITLTPPVINFQDALLVASEDILLHASLSRTCILLGIEIDQIETIPQAFDDDIAIALVSAQIAAQFHVQHPQVPMCTITHDPKQAVTTEHLPLPFRTEQLLTVLKSLSPTQAFKVLAAEDNKTNQLVFKNMVKGLDIELKIVSDGEEAVQAFHEFKPDLVFMDISMPKMDGMEATQQIRWTEIEKHLTPVKIVAMTAHATEGDKERIIGAGIDLYMTKPLKKVAIIEVIEDEMQITENSKLAS